MTSSHAHESARHQISEAEAELMSALLAAREYHVSEYFSGRSLNLLLVTDVGVAAAIAAVWLSPMQELVRGSLLSTLLLLGVAVIGIYVVVRSQRRAAEDAKRAMLAEREAAEAMLRRIADIAAEFRAAREESARALTIEG